MPLRTRIFRVALRISFLAAAFVGVLWIAIQIHQWIFRIRAGRLLADFQSIQLKQSTWQDAQRMMHRWGAWGHYDGDCNWVNCKYEVSLPDVASSFFGYSDDQIFARFLFTTRLTHAYILLGGHLGSLQMRFIVKDGVIVRTLTAVDIYEPPKLLWTTDDDQGYALMLLAQSRDSLRRSQSGGHWILGRDEQLAEHPSYKVGRPSGCTNCFSGEVIYSLDASPADIRKFTDYDLDCFIFNQCKILEDLLPAAKEWHLYEPPWGLPDNRPRPAQSDPQPCRTPLWALGRDGNAVVAFDVLSSSVVHDGSFPSEMAQMRITGALKGSVPWPNGTKLAVFPYDGDFSYPPFEAAEHLIVGKRYLALLFDEFPTLDGAPPPEYVRDGPGFRLDRCGIHEDTAENRAELAKGFAINDHLRVPEL